MTDETAPGFGSIWRERDARFSRYVKVVSGPVDVAKGKVAILTCTIDGGFVPKARVTRVAATRFPKAFDFIKEAP